MEHETTQQPLTPDHESSLELHQLNSAISAGANWFYWIAGLSLVNLAAQFFGAGFSFIVGLGFTQIVDAVAFSIARESAPNAAVVIKAVAFALDVLAASLFILFGWLANRHMAWAFIVGMVIYAFDALLFVLFQDWLGVAFHAFALFCIFSGYSALRRARQRQAIDPDEPDPSATIEQDADTEW